VTALEDRLRNELRAESEQITPDSLPALSLPPHAGRGGRLLSLAYGGGERQAARARGWRGWLTPAAASIVVAAVIAGSGALSHALFRPAAPGGPRSAAVGGTPSAAAAIRAKAVSWILHQVSRSAVVSCDVVMCGDLAGKGFPVANLWPLGPQSNDPLNSNLVVATAAVRTQFGPRLAAVYAPAVIAAFGSGKARIEIRLVYPGGATGYRAVQQAAARARRTADARLLTSSRITFSPTATAQLRGGQIDPRLPQLIATMAQKHPVQIVDFAGQSPGGGPASLLRSVDLAAADPAAHLTRAAYLHWLHRLVNAQRGEYRPTLSRVTLRNGEHVLRIGYLAPSPLS